MRTLLGVANGMLNQLERGGMGDTRLWDRLAEEQTRYLTTATGDRLELIVVKAAPLLARLSEAGRERPRRREAIAAIRASRIRVR